MDLRTDCRPLQVGIQVFFSSNFIFRGLQGLNKLFCTSQFGTLRGDAVVSVLETVLPGVTSYMLDKCSEGLAAAVNGEFPVEKIFAIVAEICEMDFAHAVSLLDLDVEIRRQEVERKQLFESFQDPHPNLVFNIRKDSWFCSLVVERVDGENYHATYVSSVRFNEVIRRILILLLICYFSLWMMVLSETLSRPWPSLITLSWMDMTRIIRKSLWPLPVLLQPWSARP